MSLDELVLVSWGREKENLYLVCSYFIIAHICHWQSVPFRSRFFFSSFLIIVCESASPLIIYIAFLWVLSSSAVAFLRLGNPKHIQHSRWNSTTDLYHGITILSVLFTIQCLILQNIMSAFFFTTAQHWAEIFNEFSAVIPDYFHMLTQLI